MSVDRLLIVSAALIPGCIDFSGQDTNFLQ